MDPRAARAVGRSQPGHDIGVVLVQGAGLVEFEQARGILRDAVGKFMSENVVGQLSRAEPQPVTKTVPKSVGATGTDAGEHRVRDYLYRRIPVVITGASEARINPNSEVQNLKTT